MAKITITFEAREEGTSCIVDLSEGTLAERTPALAAADICLAALNEYKLEENYDADSSA